jgi:hypothetical protein
MMYRSLAVALLSFVTVDVAAAQSTIYVAPGAVANIYVTPGPTNGVYPAPPAVYGPTDYTVEAPPVGYPAGYGPTVYVAPGGYGPGYAPAPYAVPGYAPPGYGGAISAYGAVPQVRGQPPIRRQIIVESNGAPRPPAPVPTATLYGFRGR